jgi:alkaline phosphatase
MKKNKLFSKIKSYKSEISGRHILLVFSLIFLLTSSVYAKGVRPTKNVIVMIPDGTSLSVLSASRWLKTYRGEESELNVDKYLCGTVTTFSSNAPIGDSAPTTSCFMTGIPQRAGNVSIYTVPDPSNDLVKLNPDSAYQPLATILEGMQILQKKSAGLVVTSEFPHATPADCSAHSYSRSNYSIIAPQMANNDLEVVFAGGNAILTDVIKQHLKSTGTSLLQNDKEAMMNFQGDKVWALFGDASIPYDLDRDTTKIPSLAQMTTKAIEVLEKNKKGFFLMVEGSKIDWSAHANDPIGIMSEFLALDNSV